MVKHNKSKTARKPARQGTKKVSKKIKLSKKAKAKSSKAKDFDTLQISGPESSSTSSNESIDDKRLRLNKMKVAALKIMLSDDGRKTSGNKKELVNRLIAGIPLNVPPVRGYFSVK